jgi:hypothetical protein
LRRAGREWLPKGAILIVSIVANSLPIRSVGR